MCEERPRTHFERVGSEKAVAELLVAFHQRASSGDKPQRMRHEFF
jgi:hypothetical protein